jgi:hypothetical protein
MFKNGILDIEVAVKWKEYNHQRNLAPDIILSHWQLGDNRIRGFTGFRVRVYFAPRSAPAIVTIRLTALCIYLPSYLSSRD